MRSDNDYDVYCTRFALVRFRLATVDNPILRAIKKKTKKRKTAKNDASFSPVRTFFNNLKTSLKHLQREN